MHWDSLVSWWWDLSTLAYISASSIMHLTPLSLRPNEDTMVFNWTHWLAAISSSQAWLCLKCTYCTRLLDNPHFHLGESWTVYLFPQKHQYMCHLPGKDSGHDQTALDKPVPHEHNSSPFKGSSKHDHWHTHCTNAWGTFPWTRFTTW